jgi:hypothetical protein
VTLVVWWKLIKELRRFSSNIDRRRFILSSLPKTVNCSLSHSPVAHPGSTPAHINTPHIMSPLCSDCHGRVTRETDVLTSHVKHYNNNATQWPIHATEKRSRKGDVIVVNNEKQRKNYRQFFIFCVPSVISRHSTCS